jgi:hypothetical protein
MTCLTSEGGEKRNSLLEDFQLGGALSVQAFMATAQNGKMSCDNCLFWIASCIVHKVVVSLLWLYTSPLHASERSCRGDVHR